MLKELFRIFDLLRYRKKLEEQIKRMEETRERIAVMTFNAINDWFEDNKTILENAKRFEFLRDDPPLSLAVRRKNSTPGNGSNEYIYLDGPGMVREVDAAMLEKRKLDAGITTSLADTICCGERIQRYTIPRDERWYYMWKCVKCKACYDCRPVPESEHTGMEYSASD